MHDTASGRSTAEVDSRRLGNPALADAAVNAWGKPDDWTPLDGWARLIVGTDGQVLASDSAAREILRKRWGLCLAHGYLRAVDPANQIGLDRLISAAASEAQSLLFKLSTEKQLLVRAVGLASAKGQRLAITLRTVDGNWRPRYACLGDAFNLTHTEETVATALLDGHCPNEISQSLGVSINTVRTHIAHLHAKLQTSNREEMWRRCAPYRVI